MPVLKGAHVQINQSMGFDAPPKSVEGTPHSRTAHGRLILYHLTRSAHAHMKRPRGLMPLQKPESAAQADAMPFVEGAYAYVDQAMAWGVKYGLGVWLDLHAVPGSQNGFDSSAPLIANVRTSALDPVP